MLPFPPQAFTRFFSWHFPGSFTTLSRCCLHLQGLYGHFPVLGVKFPGTLWPKPRLFFRHFPSSNLLRFVNLHNVIYPMTLTPFWKVCSFWGGVGGGKVPQSLSGLGNNAPTTMRSGYFQLTVIKQLLAFWAHWRACPSLYKFGGCLFACPYVTFFLRIYSSAN